MCSTSSFLLRQRSENRWVQPGLLPQHGQPDGCILLVLWARASFCGAQPSRNKTCLLELGLGSPAVLHCLTGGRKEGVLLASGPPALYSSTLAAGFLARVITSAACLGPGSASKSSAWSHPMPSTFSSRRKFLCFTSHGLPSLMGCCATQPLRHSSKGTRTIGLLSSNPSCPAVVDDSSDRSHGQCPAFTRTCRLGWGGGQARITFSSLAL